jgi:hypothetical protein
MSAFRGKPDILIKGVTSIMIDAGRWLSFGYLLAQNGRTVADEHNNDELCARWGRRCGRSRGHLSDPRLVADQIIGDRCAGIKYPNDLEVIQCDFHDAEASANYHRLEFDRCIPCLRGVWLSKNLARCLEEVVPQSRSPPAVSCLLLALSGHSAWPVIHVRFQGQSGRLYSRASCPLMTQSGHQEARGHLAYVGHFYAEDFAQTASAGSSEADSA